MSSNEGVWEEKATQKNDDYSSIAVEASAPGSVTICVISQPPRPYLSNKGSAPHYTSPLSLSVTTSI